MGDVIFSLAHLQRAWRAEVCRRVCCWRSQARSKPTQIFTANFDDTKKMFLPETRHEADPQQETGQTVRFSHLAGNFFYDTLMSFLELSNTQESLFEHFCTSLSVLCIN